MSDKRGNSSLGEQILNAVDDILESGNFDKLNSVVSDTVSKALEETRKQLEQVASRQASRSQTDNKHADADGRNAGNSQSYGRTSAVSKTSGQTTPSTARAEATSELARRYNTLSVPRNKLKRVGGVSGILFKVFGGIGTGIFGFLFLAGALSAIVDGGSWAAVAVVGILLVAALSLISLGASRSARLKRAERYVQVMQGKAYINLADLALLVNKSKAYVRRDIRKMIRLGIFPEGHLDMQEECLILGDVAYREYIRLEKSRKALQAEEERKRIEAHNAQQMAEREAAKAAKEAAKRAEKETAEKAEAAEVLAQTENAELNAMIREGNDCILQLRNLNDAIEGEVISNKLFYLENLLKEIFEQLKEHPEQMPEMHKFMEYYLPTTLKLVTAYEEFDRVSVPGEDILSAKSEIEKTLDTINMAFSELLNKLFRDRAFDAATDAQVLKTMLEREGLTKQPIFASRATESAEKRTK